jgi:hypothetical protein
VGREDASAVGFIANIGELDIEGSGKRNAELIEIAMGDGAFIFTAGTIASIFFFKDILHIVGDDLSSFGRFVVVKEYILSSVGGIGNLHGCKSMFDLLYLYFA